MYRTRATTVARRASLAVPRVPFHAIIPRPHFQQSRFYLYIALGRGAARISLLTGVIIGVLRRWIVSPAFYRNIVLISAGAGGIYLCNLEQVPITRRWRFNIVSSSIKQKLGVVGVEQVRQEYGEQFIPEDDPRVRTVKNVLARLLPYAEGEFLKDMNWEVIVIECLDNNAFVYPGGKIFFNTGLLALCKDEDDVAVILGHEIAHIVARHSAERLSQGFLVLLILLSLSLFDTSLPSWKYLINRFLRMPASRMQEAEADYIGLMMMTQGCYKPQTAIDFWARMKEMQSQQPTQLLDTHPSHHDREENFREWLPEAMEKAQASECSGTS